MASSGSRLKWIGLSAGWVVAGMLLVAKVATSSATTPAPADARSPAVSQQALAATLGRVGPAEPPPLASRSRSARADAQSDDRRRWRDRGGRRDEAGEAARGRERRDGWRGYDRRDARPRWDRRSYAGAPPGPRAYAYGDGWQSYSRPWTRWGWRPGFDRPSRYSYWPDGSDRWLPSHGRYPSWRSQRHDGYSWPSGRWVWLDRAT